jgi:hypothetical protein
VTAPAADASSVHMIVLPGGGYAEHAPGGYSEDTQIWTLRRIVRGLPLRVGHTM